VTEVLLEARGIEKRFGHVTALRGADFSVHEGEVVALVGDNGSGKSTLVKILSGALQSNAGEIRFAGQVVHLPTTVAARQLGIETVYQDLALALDLDSTSNLFLGREVVRQGLMGWLGFLDRTAMSRRTDEAFASLGVSILDAAAPVATFSGGQRQGVAVARAVTWASRIAFMDEPTAALGVVQTRRVLDLIRRVRDSGVAVVLISHNMAQVMDVADRAEVLRLGHRVAQFTRAEMTNENLVGAMTGALSAAAP
jgi:simple sugar transport system ATP-binding protein